MTFHRRFRTVAGIAAVAVATTFGAGIALAQPQGPHGHHHGGGEVALGQLIAHAKEKLGLNTMQQGMFDTAVAHSKAAREAGRGLHEKVKSTLQAELAKAEPDLAAVSTLFEGVEEQSRASRRQVREQWLKLYANLRPDQKTLVRDALRERLSHAAEGSREKVRERMQQPRAPS